MVVEAYGALLFVFDKLLKLLTSEMLYAGHKKGVVNYLKIKGEQLLDYFGYKKSITAGLQHMQDMRTIFLVSCGVYKTVLLIYCVREK